MGFSASWVAVQGASRDEVLAQLGLEPSGVTDRYPEFKVCLAELPGDWLLIWYDYDLKAAFKRGAELSVHGRAVACAVEEHVMFSEARGYDGGAETWRVTHDPEEGASLYHLETAGEPPRTFEEIHARLKAEQDAEGGDEADVDFLFDAPAELALSICGYKHDNDPPDGVVFEELRRVRTAGGSGKPGIFARLFGAR